MGRVAALLVVAVLLSACGSAAPTTAATTTASTSASLPVPTATATSAATSAATVASWNVASSSKAVVSVREQLVGVNLPSDAVLTATGGAGTFGLKADGTFSTGSKITFDLTTLASDSRSRDNYVKQTTLDTRQFPEAEFVPTKTSGLALPLAASGTFSFTLTGNLMIHGTTKEVSFDVVASRDATGITATATLAPTVKFGDFGMTPPSVPFRVVSVVDEIHLVVHLTATGAAM